MRDERGDRALSQAGIHREGHVGRAKELVDDLRHEHRQALAAEFGRRRDADPAAFDDLLEGVLETRRRGHAAVALALAAFLVADAIERSQHLLAELGGLAENSFDDVRRCVGEAGQVGIAVDAEDVVKQELHVIDRRLVARHEFGSPGCESQHECRGRQESKEAACLGAAKSETQAGRPRACFWRGEISRGCFANHKSQF